MSKYLRPTLFRHCYWYCSLHLELCSPLKNHHVSKVILEIRLILTVIAAAFVIIGACSVVERITSVWPGED